MLARWIDLFGPPEDGNVNKTDVDTCTYARFKPNLDTTQHNPHLKDMN